MRWTWTWNSTPVDAQVLLFNKRYPSTCLAQNPLVIEHGNWQSPIRGGFNGKIIYKLKIFHCHVWFPAGTFQMTFFRSLGWYINTYIYIYTYRCIQRCSCTLWLFNIAMENGPFIDGLPVYLLKMVISMAMLVITRGYMQHIPAGNVQFHWRPLFLSTCIGRWFRSAFLHLSGEAKNIISIQLIFWGFSGIIMGFHRTLVENHELYIYIYTLWYFNIDMENHLHTNFHGYLNYCHVCVWSTVQWPQIQTNTHTK